MASILKVDELQGIATAGDITVTSEGGAATQSLQQGLAKAWGNINGVTTTVLNDSLNYSSLTDDGGGKTTMTFASSMASGNYSLTTACGLNGDTIFGGDLAAAYIVTTASHRIQSRDQGGALTDPDIACSQVIGDLA